MLKKRMLVICLAVMLALGGCGGPKREAAGLLTMNEIAKYEGLYLQGTDILWDGLGLTEDDLADQDFGRWELKNTRSIAEKDFQQTLLLSEVVPDGLMGAAFHRRLESDSERAELLRELYDQAVSIYGPPDTYPGHDEDSRILKQLEKELPGGCFETWNVGERTQVELRLFIPSEMGPLVDGVPGIAIEYRCTVTE